ncbi:hypothetical protein B0H67DRAFT_670128 [Lasiosphaeris hirsuta]|uniref:Zn(2)-C6 fungal-type domain-containing protein n=1 Tax=Lasiosphaeris hirsuta TaxID=260670 RepID=A0AA40A0Z2_9PEZI|nr:hypothetical protein B0H67DRAFT_670128 [Lasiosphaeris hirsuta]
MDEYTEHKTRRPHRKSRNGCTRCKERRIKCDELTPRCSRCHRMNLDCQYKRQASAEDAADPIDALMLQLQVSPRGPGSPESSGHESGGSPLSTASSSGVSLRVPRHEVPRPGSPLRAAHPQTLAPAELDLFKHYLEHTSKDLTVDEDDQYTLQVGIPNLACQSKPLMRSVLALAAVCRCCDMIAGAGAGAGEAATEPSRARVAELLALADGYHMDSLREIQATLPRVKQYDHVLANAAMMGMYGSGSHRTRIWLAQTAGPDAPPYAMPKHSQWISLFRAAYLAYAGLLPPETAHSPAPFDYQLTPHLTAPLPPSSTRSPPSSPPPSTRPSRRCTPSPSPWRPRTRTRTGTWRRAGRRWAC